jgi:hypothetical protein
MAFDYDLKKPNLGHPDSAIRLASAVHRFRCPKMTQKVCFARSFHTVGSHHATTKDAMRKADEARSRLNNALTSSTVSHERVVTESRKYLPLINQVLLTCKVQPEVARLDERLLFEWTSGVEKDPEPYSSEALMYDMVMCIACEALGWAGSATDASMAGEFPAASRDYAKAAGIFSFLAEETLPQWVARGTDVNDSHLPTEATVGACKAFAKLCLAEGQQMAVAAVLIKPGVPNYALVAKLCLSISQQIEEFISIMRKEAFAQMSRMDSDFFTLMTFQINLQKSLANYFYARSFWDETKYGLAIATLSEATVTLQTRSHSGAPGLPDLSKTSLRALQNDVKDLQTHMGLLLKTWEDDNTHVYFEGVPKSIPQDQKLLKGIQLSKVDPFQLETVDPLPLSIPDKTKEDPPPPPYSSVSHKRSDSDLARELQEKINAGLE